MNPLNIAKSALQKIFKSADIDDFVRNSGLSAVDDQFKNAVYGDDVWSKLPKTADDVAKLGDNLDTSQQLIGVHSINQKTLPDAVTLGGFARPSQAVFNPSKWEGPKLPNDAYGDVFLVANKGLMDRSKKYTGDAWTSMFPTENIEIQYKPNQQVIDDIWDKYGDAYKNYKHDGFYHADSKEELYNLAKNNDKQLGEQVLAGLYSAGNGLDNPVPGLDWAAKMFDKTRDAYDYKILNNDGELLPYTPDNVSKVMMDNEQVYGRPNNDTTAGVYELWDANDAYQNAYKLAKDIRPLRYSLNEARDALAKKADRQIREETGDWRADGTGNFSKEFVTDNMGNDDEIPEGFSDELYDNLDTLRQSYVNAPRPYFEFKPDGGAIGADFYGAYIPHDASQDVVDNLNKLGITNIKRYGGKMQVY